MIGFSQKEAQMPKEPTKIPNENTQAYVRSLGLDPNDIAQEGWTDKYYFTFVKSAMGTIRKKVEWPEAFDLDTMIDAMKKDGLIR